MARARSRRTLLAIFSLGLPAALLMAVAPAEVGWGGLTTGSHGLHGPTAIVNHLQGHRSTQLQRQELSGQPGGDAGGESQDIRAAAAQWNEMRAAPGLTVPDRAFDAGQQQGMALPRAGGTWRELTNRPYQNDTVGWRDPVWSDSMGGWGFTSGRISALATSGPRTVYAGGADGGVWVSQDRGHTWRSVFDRQSNLSIGALAVNPRTRAVWVGEGEANLSGDEYPGDGIYRSVNGGNSWKRVGGMIFGLTTARLVFDGHGHIYAATNHGVLRHSATTASGPWQTLLAPAGATDGSFATDVQVQPGSNGQTVVATIVNGGYGSGSQNGFYLSTDGGATWQQEVTTTGDLLTSGMGRTSFVYTPDGSTMYAVAEAAGAGSFYGVFKSTNGPAGPWTMIADHDTFAAISAYPACAGCQGWYDQYITVDPKDPSHIYVGLEEVFESSDSGGTWSNIGPYWNFGMPCWSIDPSTNTCPDTTHPDQHAMAFGRDGTAYFGNDGGVYSRQASLRNVVSWTDDNKTLHTLQYYSVGIGKVHSGDAVWGGMQDNGTSLLLPRKRVMVAPMGGDGGVVLVDPNHGNRAVNEYVYMNMAHTANAGRSDGNTESYTTANPSCDNVLYALSPCDPNAMFIAPYSADIHNIDHWVAGGEYVWDNQGKGWSTSCTPSSCDWKMVHDTGAQITSVVASGNVIYAAWQYRDSSGVYHSGIDTNFGGSWHRVAGANLPSRYIASISIDPSDAGHLFISFGGYTQKWVPGGGVGHVFESTDGAASWTDVTGNFPDLPTSSIVQWHGALVAGTDAGVYTTSLQNPGRWKRLGGALPNASVNMLAVAPGGGYIVAATHGRGLWKLASR
ncbi:MAG: WD40/YVTN/BNR-like repeat-containing protein [Nocardioidaceae bacterium]